MPVWRIYHPSNTFTTKAEKEALSKDITAIYTLIPLPAFYVVVLFIPLPEENTFIGGEVRPSKTAPPFIRIIASNIARKIPENAAERKTIFLNRIDKALKPHIADKGYDWEYHVEESDRSLWKEQGMIPPAPGSEEEKLWIRENRPVEYDGAYPPGRGAL